MSPLMNKEFLMRLPMDLYERTKAISEKEYKSVSALIRELLIERIGDNLSQEEMTAVQAASKQFHAGKGKNWRTIKRG